MNINYEQVETFNDSTMRDANNKASIALSEAGHKHKTILFGGEPCVKFVNNPKGAQFMREWIAKSEYDFGFNFAFNK